jgi:predicted alpha/beta hydrolase family esterase
MKKTLFFFLIFLSISNAWADNQQSQKLAQKLPPDIGRVAFGNSGTITYFVKRPKESPKAIIFSMQGSNGCLYGRRGKVRSEEDLISNKGPSRKHPSFMIKWVPSLLDSSFLVVLPNCPDVSHNSSGVEYAAAMLKIIQAVKGSTKLPVFFSGMSRGTIRAVNAASHLGSEIRGVILLSAVTGRTYDGTVFDPPYKKISSSVLMIIHRNDGCVSSESLSRLRSFNEDLSLANDKTISVIEGGQNASDDSREAQCGAKSHHGMYGIEQEVISRVIRWVQKRLN